MTRARICGAILSILAVALAGQPAAVAGEKHHAHDATVKSRADDTEIAITVFRPASASSERRVPVILQSHGWAGSRETEIAGVVKSFLDAGFGVVSIDQRGHGESGGQAHVQDPTKETEDVKAVIDHIAGLDWVQLDGPGDPVLGAIGGSYGGGYQTMTALDEIADEGHTRFNALAPEITWYDLPESLAPQKVVRSVWNVLLYAVGAPMVPDFIHEGFAWGTASNHWPDGTFYGQKVDGVPNLDKIFHRHSPIWYAERNIHIDVPMLLREGISDNLFNLNQGVHIFDEVLSAPARSESYLIGYNGGHALPNALPAGTAAGDDACSPKGNFTKLTIEFYRRVFSGGSTDGLLPSRYNLTTADGEKCLHLDRWPSTGDIGVDPSGYGTMVAPTGVGAPVHIPIAEGPLTIAGIPKLSGKVTSVGLDAREFFGLAIGTTPADAQVIQNNLMPLRQVLPAQDQKFSIELPGVAVEVPEGQSLFLTISPVSDMYAAHHSRTPGGMLFNRLAVSLPSIKR